MDQQKEPAHCPKPDCKGDNMTWMSTSRYWCPMCGDWAPPGEALEVLEVLEDEPAKKEAPKLFCPRPECRNDKRAELSWDAQRGAFVCLYCKQLTDAMDTLQDPDRAPADFSRLAAEADLQPGKVRQGRVLTYEDRVLLAAPLFAAHQHMHGTLTVLLAGVNLDDTQASVESAIDTFASRWSVGISVLERKHLHHVAGLLVSNRGYTAVREAAGTLAALSAEIRSLGVDLDDAVSAQDAMEEMVKRNRKGTPSDA